jgi:hypothetical protein
VHFIISQTREQFDTMELDAAIMAAKASQAAYTSFHNAPSAAAAPVDWTSPASPPREADDDVRMDDDEDVVAAPAPVQPTRPHTLAAAKAAHASVRAAVLAARKFLKEYVEERAPFLVDVTTNKPLSDILMDWSLPFDMYDVIWLLRGTKVTKGERTIELRPVTPECSYVSRAEVEELERIVAVLYYTYNKDGSCGRWRDLYRVGNGERGWTEMS